MPRGASAGRLVRFLGHLAAHSMLPHRRPAETGRSEAASHRLGPILEEYLSLYLDRVMRCYRSLTVAAQLQVDAATVKKRSSRSKA